MTSIEQIIPGFKLPEHEMVTFAKDQPPYVPLHAWRNNDDPQGRIVARFGLSWRERLQILLGGSVWLSVLTFNRALQPVNLSTECPLMGSAMLDEEV